VSQNLYPPKTTNPYIEDIEQYHRLYKESLENPKEFFNKLANENISWLKDFDEVHNESFANTKWFEGGKTNVSFNCIDRHLKNNATKTRSYMGR